MSMQKLKQFKIKYLLLFISTIFITNLIQSCIIRQNYKINQSEVVEFIELINVEYKDTYYLSKDFRNYVRNNIPKIDREDINIYCQPLQAIYFDSRGQIISYNTNTLKRHGIFSNVWTTEGIYNVFPPLYNPNHKMSVDLNRDSLVKYLDPVFYNQNAQDTTKYDYYVFVFGGLALEGLTKSLIKTINANINSATVKYNIKKYFVITDEFVGYKINK